MEEKSYNAHYSRYSVVGISPRVIRFADLQFPLAITGAGFGNDPRALTVQVHANGFIESGCVGLDGANLVVGPDACSGWEGLAGMSRTRTAFPSTAPPHSAALESPDASQLVIVFDATEPAGNLITVDQLVLKFYSCSGLLLQVHTLAAPVTFDTTAPGNGKTDYTFVLDAAQAQEAQAIVSPSVRVALESSLSQVKAGPESFFFASSESLGITIASIPEPTSLALMGAGLLGVMLLKLKRPQQAKRDK